MKREIIVDNVDSVGITLPQKGFNLVKNIILEVFIICSVFAPFLTNLCWCFLNEPHVSPDLRTFFNTLYFFAAGTVFALFSDKKWNIPFMVYMLLTAVGGAACLIAYGSAFADFCEIFILPTYWGIKFAVESTVIYGCIVLLFAVVMLFFTVRKYTVNKYTVKKSK